MIEDDPTIRQLMSRELTARGCEVIAGAGGAETVAEVSRHGPPCVVFVDTVVPEMEAVNVAERLRELGIGEEGPRIVAVTASGTSEGVRLLGAADCVEKPFSLARVVELVVRRCTRAVRRR